MNLMDVIVIGIILIFAVMGFIRGLLITVFNIVSFIAAIFLTYLLYPHVTGLLSATPLYGAVRGWTDSLAGTESFGAALNDLPGFVRNAIDRSSAGMANMIINAISVILVFVVILSVLKIVSKLLKLISRLPVINTLNRIGGVGVGIVQGVLVVWIVLILMSGLFAVNQTFPVNRLVSESLVAGPLQEANILLRFVTKNTAAKEAPAVTAPDPINMT